MNWQPIEISVPSRPPREVSIAAAVRQMLRAREVGDQAAMWQARHWLGILVTSLIKELMSKEPSWKLRERWLDCFSPKKVAIASPYRCRMSGAIIWGYVDDDEGEQWADPVECEMDFTDGFVMLRNLVLRYGDQRSFPNEGLKGSVERIPSDIESQAVQWAVFLQHHFVDPDR